MYIPPPEASKFFVNEDEMSVNAPAVHQRIIALLIMGLGHLYHHTKSIPYEPLPEMMLDYTYSSPTPDVILYDNKTDQTKIIIEICYPSGLKMTFGKLSDWLTKTFMAFVKDLSITTKLSSGTATALAMVALWLNHPSPKSSNWI